MTVFKTFSCTFLLLILAFSHAQTLESCEKMIVEGVNEMSQKNHITSLEILTKARAIAHENNWTKQEFLAVNNIGANYYMMLDYGEALENYLDAYKIALKSLDNKHEMIVLNNIAILYSKEQSFDKAEEYFQKAYDIAKENNDSVKIGIYSVNLAVVAVKKSETNKADHFLNVSFNHLKKTSTIYLQAIVVKAQNLILKKQYDEAKKIAENLLPQLNTSELSEQRISILMLLADVYENQNDNLKAIEYTKQALYDPQSTIENKIEAYQKVTLMDSVCFDLFHD